MRRTLFSLLALLTILLAGTSITDGKSKTNVLVIGDSLSVGSAESLRKQMPNTHFLFDHRVGRGSAEGLAHLRADVNGDHDIVVYAMGTNDDPGNPSALRKNMEAAYKVVVSNRPKRCMVIATVHLPGNRDAGLNKALQAFHRAHSKNVRIADWDQLVTKRPGLLAGDGVHGSGANAYKLRADLIKKAIRRCA